MTNKEFAQAYRKKGLSVIPLYSPDLIKRLKPKLLCCAQKLVHVNSAIGLHTVLAFQPLIEPQDLQGRMNRKNYIAGVIPIINIDSRFRSKQDLEWE